MKLAIQGERCGRVSNGSVLDIFGDPLWIIGRDRRVLWKNSAARKILALKGGFSEREGRLDIDSRSVCERLLKILSDHQTRGDGVPELRGIRLARPGAARDWLLLLRPLEDGEFGRDAFLLQFIGRIRPRNVSLQVLGDLYDLTRRERDLVASMLRTGTLLEAARRLHIARETARTHLKRVFRKCQVNSQEELISLLHCLCRFCPVDTVRRSQTEGLGVQSISPGQGMRSIQGNTRIRPEYSNVNKKLPGGTEQEC